MQSVPKSWPLVAVVVTLSVLSFFGLTKLVALVPGSYHFYTPLTSQLIEDERGVLKAFWNAGVGWWLLARLETSSRLTLQRIVVTTLVVLTVAGNLTELAHITMYVSSAQESLLYKPVMGTDPLVCVLALLVHATEGGTAAFPGMGFPVALLPVVNSLFVAVTDYLGLTNSLGLTLSATVVGWTYLRFFAAVPGSLPTSAASGTATAAAAGYSGDAFSALSLLPHQLHAPLRPLNALLSSLFMPLVVRAQALAHSITSPSSSSSGSSSGGSAAGSSVTSVFNAPFSPAPAHGASSLASPGSPAPSGPVGAGSRIDLHVHLHGTGRLAAPGTPGGSNWTVAPDPVAERRRERALQALERKLTEVQEIYKKEVVARAGVGVAMAPPRSAADKAGV